MENIGENDVVINQAASTVVKDPAVVFDKTPSEAGAKDLLSPSKPPSAKSKSKRAANAAVEHSAVVVDRAPSEIGQKHPVTTSKSKTSASEMVELPAAVVDGIPSEIGFEKPLPPLEPPVATPESKTLVSAVVEHPAAVVDVAPSEIGFEKPLLPLEPPVVTPESKTLVSAVVEHPAAVVDVAPSEIGFEKPLPPLEPPVATPESKTLVSAVVEHPAVVVDVAPSEIGFEKPLLATSESNTLVNAVVEHPAVVAYETPLDNPLISPVGPPPATAESQTTESAVDVALKNALDLKNEGGYLFGTGNFEGARQKYVNALESLQYIGDVKSDKHKAALFELSIPLSSNTALCCFKEGNYVDTTIFTRNALIFIKALEDKTESTSEIWDILLARGLTYQKLMDFKKKSLVLGGKAEFYRYNYTEALSSLNQALSLIPVSDRGGSKEADELTKWINKVAAKDSQTRKKEKAMWGKAFKKDIENEVTDTASTDIDHVAKNKDVNGSTKVIKNDVNSSLFSNPTVIAGALGAMSVVGMVGMFFYLRSRKHT
jgi:hypothetical protein